MSNIDPNKLDLEERVVAVNRVSKVVKGGRSLRFAAIVVVGDKNGHVGFGTGKAQEVPEAIKKAIENAKKNLIKVPIVGTTIPHEIHGQFRFWPGPNEASRRRYRSYFWWSCPCGTRISRHR